MKRDMDLIRQLLLEIEAEPSWQINRFVQLVDGIDEDTQVGHLYMLTDAGYLEQLTLPGVSGRDRPIGWRMTWQGAEFLETVRDPEIWRQTKSAASKVGSYGVKVLADLAAGFIKSKAVALGFPIA